MEDDLDVIVVGAGLAGIGTAARLRRTHPELRIAVLEGRDAIGGTWDLFRFPGVRSDSDMFTLGYPFRPWTDTRSLAPADAIRDYIRDTADAEGITPLIRLGHQVAGAGWDSTAARWTVRVTAGGEASTLTTSFLVLCCGYYRYDAGYTPDLSGLRDFAGEVVHPQHWPERLELDGRRVVVVGSGATAVTLVPALAERGAQVTMLQRSPTYVAAVPRIDRFAARAGRTLPAPLAYRAARLKNLAFTFGTYQFSRLRPDAMRGVLLRNARAKLPAGYDVDTHFSPRYAPWDERLCAVPGGDLFTAIRSGRAEVVTDRIASILPDGVALESGRTLPADVLVTATGLVLRPLGGVPLEVDGQPVDVPTRVAYRGMMLAGVPNLAYAMGYVNASWTLKSDLMARFVSRLLGRLRRGGRDTVVPVLPAGGSSERPFIELRSGYIQRGVHLMPRQGRSGPWRVHQNYLRDAARFRFGPLSDGLRFERRRGAPVGRWTDARAGSVVPHGPGAVQDGAHAARP